MNDDRTKGWLLAAVGMLLVSTDSLFVRLAEADGWTVAFLVSAFSLPVMLLLNRRFTTENPIRAVRDNPGPLIVVAVLASVSHVSFITAITRTDVANVVVIVAAAPIMAAVFGRIILGDRTSRQVWIAIGITMVGVGVVVSQSIGEPDLDGDLLALLAILAFAINMNVWRLFPSLNRFVGLALSSALVLVATAGFTSPFSLEPRTYLATAAMGLLFSPAGRLAHTNAPRFAPAAEVALFTPVETVAATIWAWLAFSEQPQTATVIGGVIVLAGVAFGTVRRPVPSTMVPVGR